MLGLGSSLLQGGALRSIVRSGLQLFYKADRTQAPLGEEQVRNNSFDEISGNLVSNHTFDLGSEAVQNGTFNLGSEEVVNGDFATDLSSWDISGTDATHTVTYSNGSARYQSDSVTPQLNFDQTISNVEVGKTYQLSIDVTYTTGSLKVSSIDTNQTVLSNGLNVFSVVANSKTIRLLRSASIVDALINSISLKEVPNWGLQSPWSINNNKAFYDVTEINYISQSGLTITAGKTYQVSFDIEDSSGQSRMLISNQAANESYSPYTYRANGSYVVTFTSSTNQSTLAFKGHTSGTSFSLSNVSLKEVPNWELGDGWSIANDVAIQSGGVGQLSQTGVLAAGKSYSVSVTIDSIASGTSLKVSLGSGGDELLFSNIGTTTLIGSTSSSVGNQILYLLGNESGFSGSISNISVKQLDPNNRWNVLNPDTSAHTVEIREGETYINYDHDGGTQGGTGITQSGVFPNTTSKYEIEVELGEVTGELKVQARGISTTINSSDSNTTKVILLDSSSDSQTHIMIVRLEDYISGSAFVKNVSVKEITNSIKDHSKNSNDGILYSGKALALDPDTGALDYVSLKPSNEIGITSAGFTFAIWFKADSTQSNGEDDRIFTSLRTYSSSYFSIGLTTSGHLRFHLRSSTSLPSTVVQNDYRDDKWHRVVVSASPTVQYVYVDNELVSTTTVVLGGTPSADLARLGTAPQPSSTYSLKCNLADLQTYDKAWNATDVKYDWENPDKDVFDRVGEAQVLGSEEVVDGDFPTGTTAWELINGATISGNKANIIGDGSTFTSIKQTGVFENGKDYQVVVDVTINSGLGLKFQDGATNENIGFATTTGIYTFNFTGASNADLVVGRRTFGTAFNSSVNSISVKEVTTHASHILPTDCKSLLRLNEGAGDRVYDAAPVLGAEKVINTNFESNTGFSEGTGWNINNNLATHTGSTGNLGIISSWVSGASYKIVFTIDVIDDGVCNVYDSSTATTYASFDTDGTKTLFIKKDSTSELALRSSSSNCEISFLSVKEIKPAESFAIVGDKDFIHQQPYIPQYAMSSFSKKMVFDGSNDYVTGSFNGNIGPAEDITFSCWFSYEDNVVSSSDRQTLFGLLFAPTDEFPYRKFEVGIYETNRIVVYTGDGTTATPSSTLSDISSPLSNNKLNHVAVSLSSNGLVKIYVNGVENTTATHTNFGASSINNYRIGSRRTSGTSSLFNKGIIDEVSLFKSELTQAEVLELYNSGSSFDSTGHSKYNLGEEVSNGTFELGSEEVVNGDFATDSDWVEGLGFDISGGVMNYDGSAIAYRRANQVLNTEIGATYKLEFTLNDLSASGVNFGFGNSDGSFSGIAQQTYSSDGTYTRYMVATIEDHSIVIQNNSATQTFNVDNISVKKIPNWSSSTASSATMTVNTSGQLELTSDAGDTLGAYSSISLVQGRTYVLSVDIISSNRLNQIRIGTSASVGSTSPKEILDAAGSGVPVGTNTYTFTATSAQASNGFLYIGGRDDVNSLVIDNVSLQEYGLSAYWRNNGADQWDDLSINSNHGTVSGSPTEIFLQEVPFFGKDSLGMFMNKPRLGGLNFNGSGYVEIHDTNDLDFPAATGVDNVGEFSVECWVRYKFLSQGSTVNCIYSNGEEVNDVNTFSLITNQDNKIGFYVNGTLCSSASTFSLDEWVHVVGIREHGTNGVKLYINGNTTPEATATNNNTVTNSFNKRIGWDGHANRYLESVVDDVKLYNRALTPTEIKKNYNATKGKHKN